ncbi:FAD-dependent monooxygenase [Sphaerisporangium fuscum]|uniref:FAD-dependent monooxygenase n=1 Tax=Sphaerisporangium fuscum TaxID=2835868 RepID=UPI001BDCA286|nr:FAD-dependent monooxygenase [Sphaerisporangium fuscum]
MYDERVPVLVAGAGYAGLSAALLLSWRGVRVLLVERHASTSFQPKAFGVNERAMELLRVVPGVEEALRKRSEGIPQDIRIAIASTLTDPDPQMIVHGSDDFAFVRDVTPTSGVGLPQSLVESTLRAEAERHGADLRFSTELVHFEQDDDGVTAVIRDRASGDTRTVRADYLIGADGHRSGVRERLGVPVEGRGELGLCRSIMFRADLSEQVDERTLTLWYLRNDAFDGAIVTGTGVGVHVMAINFDPSLGQSETDFTEERCVELVRIGTGVPDLEVKIVDQNTWALGHAVATRFSSGRVFLAGDAAHTMPPTGGQGGSTALQDGCDLAWRLALVLSGQAGPGLLDSYDAERRPIGKLTADAQLANLGFRMPPAQRVDFPEPVADPYSYMLGHRYHSKAVLTEPGDDGSIAEDVRHLTGRPGGRAPHFTISAGGEEMSVLELFGRAFVLLTGAGTQAGAWASAAATTAERLGVQLEVYRIGEDVRDVSGDWAARYGVTDAGAVLVRPDGYVAWRSPSPAPDPATALHDVLTRVLARD